MPSVKDILRQKPDVKLLRTLLPAKAGGTVKKWVILPVLEGGSDVVLGEYKTVEGVVRFCQKHGLKIVGTFDTTV